MVLTAKSMDKKEAPVVDKKSAKKELKYVRKTNEENGKYYWAWE